MTYLAAALAVACFAMALDRLRVLEISRRAIQAGRDASRIMQDRSTNDARKEQLVRSASLTLFHCFGAITWRSAAAVAISVLPVMLLQVTDFVRLSSVNRLLLSWNGLLLAAGTFAVVHFARSRL